MLHMVKNYRTICCKIWTFVFEVCLLNCVSYCLKYKRVEKELCIHFTHNTPATCDKFDDIQLFSHFWPSISHIRWKLSNRKLWPLSQQHIMLVKRENIGMTYACIKIQTTTTLAIYLLKRLYFSFHPQPCSQLCIYR